MTETLTKPAVNDRYHLEYWSANATETAHLAGEVVATEDKPNGWRAIIWSDRGEKRIVEAEDETLTVFAETNANVPGKRRVIGRGETDD